MKTLVAAEDVQAVWLGSSHNTARVDEMLDRLNTAIGGLTDQQIADALICVSRVDLALERVPGPHCSCVEERIEDELVQCPTLGPALVEAARHMMVQALESIRGWNVLGVNGGWVAAGVADDDHYTGAILIGQLDPLAEHRP